MLLAVRRRLAAAKADRRGLRALELQIMNDPAAGDVIPGGGGVRQLRFAPPSWRRGKSAATRPGVGARLVEGLTELRNALRSGRPLAEQLTVRTVELPDEPGLYDPQ